MIGIDTKVLVRYLVHDDRAQAATAGRLFKQARSDGERVWIACIVLCEVAWTLRFAYSYSRPEILDTLEAVLDTDIFDIESEAAVRAAVRRARQDKGDFPDYLIGELNVANGCRTTVTFDRALHGSDLFVSP